MNSIKLVVSDEHLHGEICLSECEDDAHIGSEKRLWAATIIQALIDATAEPATPQQQTYKAQAHAWFTAEVGVTAGDFEAVCLAAGLQPDTVRRFYLSYEGAPLSQRKLSQLRDKLLKG